MKTQQLGSQKPHQRPQKNQDFLLESDESVSLLKVESEMIINKNTTSEALLTIQSCGERQLYEICP